MPPCSGIAVGVDRLLMVLLGKDQLADVMSIQEDENMKDDIKPADRRI